MTGEVLFLEVVKAWNQRGFIYGFCWVFWFWLERTGPLRQLRDKAISIFLVPYDHVGNWRDVVVGSVSGSPIKDVLSP